MKKLILLFVLLVSCTKDDTPIVIQPPTPSPTPKVNTIDFTRLLWSDEFNTDGKPSGLWNHELGDHGWGNNERQNYVDSRDNSIVKDSVLEINAIKDQEGRYTSARMTTEGNFEFKYGRVEIRAKLPVGRGTWPALWMLGSNFREVGWPNCGELDIMEHGNKEHGYVSSAVHRPGNPTYTSGGQQLSEPDEFHVYRMDWTANSVSFYVDDRFHHSADLDKTFQQPFFFIFNVAMGGTFPHSIDPNLTSATMEVDYVRVYQ